MKPIPHAREVDKALRAVKSTVRVSLKQLNGYAGQLMAKGDYESAMALASRGQDIQAFQSEVEALRGKWAEIRSSGKAGPRRKKTPLWMYFQPILKALVQLGGQARRPEIEPVVEGLMKNSFEPADLEPMARGKLRWQVMIQRAHKDLVREGWLDKHTKGGWKITPSGRQAAKAAPGRTMPRG